MAQRTWGQQVVVSLLRRTGRAVGIVLLVVAGVVLLMAIIGAIEEWPWP